jgi:glycerol kinase
MPGSRTRKGVVVAVDAGTTGVRCLAVDEGAEVAGVSYRELTQHFPRPGLVEHDASEIWNLVEETLAEIADELAATERGVVAIGITNQRETAVAWDKTSGRPLHRAIVWQDRRTAGRCEELAEAGHLPTIRERTGLVLDSYFSATKWEWMLTEGGVTTTADLALGTVDDWVLWNLTGGAGGGLHATDPSNASRTLLYDLGLRDWSGDLCELFGVPRQALGELRPSSGRLASADASVAGGRVRGVPVSGIAGDQQAALFGQCCHAPGQAKVTYGTGSFILMNLGDTLPSPVEGLLTTVAWELGDEVTYALEGAVFSSGSAIQWLRDGLGVLSGAGETGPLAESITLNDDVYLVPAFTGLGSPWWDPDARAAVFGITKGTDRAHLARAAVEAMAYQTRDVVEAMEQAAGRHVAELRADGGASVMDLLLQLQADQCRVPVVRPRTAEVTALGAALLAGLAEGVWSSLEELNQLLPGERTFQPSASTSRANSDHAKWLRALERSRHWAERG